MLKLVLKSKKVVILKLKVKVFSKIIKLNLKNSKALKHVTLDVIINIMFCY